MVTGIRIFAGLFAILTLTPALSNAQEHIVYCEEVESTAEIMKCVKRHYDDSQIRLNMVYGDLTQRLEDKDDVADLIGSQNAWLAYRDTHCAWESGRARRS